MGINCSCVTEELISIKAQALNVGDSFDNVQQQDDEAIKELQLVQMLPVLDLQQDDHEVKPPPSEDVPNVVSPKEWQRKDFFIKSTCSTASSALCIVIENPGGFEAFYTVKEKLGAGQFGTVSSAMITANGAERAVKVIEKKENSTARHVDALKAEIEIMKVLDHPNLVSICEIFEDKASIFLAMKLCKGPHLTLYVDRVCSLSEKQAAYVMRDLLRAVSYMHNSNVCHRDLKGENCLMLTQGPPERNRLKICDFGLSAVFSRRPLRGKAGSITHIAPEVLTSPEYTCACDYWSCGIIFYHLICGFLPFLEEKDVLHGRLSFADRHWCDVSEDCCRLVSGLVERDVQKRITAHAALSHKWLHEQVKASIASKPEEFRSSSRTSMSSAPSCKESSYPERVLRFRGFNKLKQAALRVIANFLPESENNAARDFFLALDLSCHGKVPWTTFCEAAGFEDADDTPKEDVGFTELIAATFDRKRGLSEKMCKAAYQSFDKSGDQEVSLKDLEEGRLIGELSPKDLRRVMRDIGDNAGMVDFASFMKMLRVDKIRKTLVKSTPDSKSAVRGTESDSTQAQSD